MSYLRKKLTDGETLIYAGKLHWVILLRPIVTLVILVIGAGVIEQQKLYQYVPALVPYKSIIYIAILILFVGLPMLKILIKKWTTVIAVTDQRLLYKRGLIAIDVQGMPLSKIENTDSRQTIMGRILGYGTVTVKGSGSTPMRFHDIAKPMRFRNELATLLNR